MLRWQFSLNSSINLQSILKSPQAFFFFFLEFNKLILKFTQKPKGPRIDKTVLEQERRAKLEDLMLPDFKTYHKAIVFKAVCNCCKDKAYRSLDQSLESTAKPLYTGSVDFQNTQFLNPRFLCLDKPQL